METPLTPKQIAAVIEKAADHAGLTTEEIMGPRRYPSLTWVRYAIWHALHAAGMTHTAIGKVFKRDASSIHYGLKEATRRLDFHKLTQSLAESSTAH